MTPPKPKLRKRQIDLLLLSIIRAYEHPSRDDEAARLAAARKALFGEKTACGHTTTFDDLAIFKIQAEQRKREVESLARAGVKNRPDLQTPEWEEEISRDPISVRAAAREFMDFAGPIPSDEGIEDRLRRKARKPLSSREMAELEALFDPEAPHTRTIITVLELLETLGVQSETIWDENT